MMYDSFFREYFPFWDHLKEDDREYLCRNSSLVHFEKEQSIHNSMGCTGLYIVKTGKLRLYMISDEGKEVTLYRLMPGDICMLSASCVLKSITFDVYLDAELPSDCVMISGMAFSAVSERVPEVKIYALENAVARFSDVMWTLQQIVFMSMDQRLAIFLLDEVNANGADSVTMTHEQIARHLGTAREVVTRLLKRFAAEGWVEVTRKEIRILDKKKLRELAC